jgi:hypothetical protein
VRPNPDATLATRLHDGDRLTLLVAVAGGSHPYTVFARAVRAARSSGSRSLPERTSSCSNVCICMKDA